MNLLLLSSGSDFGQSAVAHVHRLATSRVDRGHCHEQSESSIVDREHSQDHIRPSIGKSSDIHEAGTRTSMHGSATTTTAAPVSASTVVPGTRLGHCSQFACGPGTYERQSHVYAALVGRVLGSGKKSVVTDYADSSRDMISIRLRCTRSPCVWRCSGFIVIDHPHIAYTRIDTPVQE